jgi:hypothetical protein
MMASQFEIEREESLASDAAAPIDRHLPRFQMALKDVAAWVFSLAIALALLRWAWHGQAILLGSAFDNFAYRGFVWATTLLAAILGLRLVGQVFGLALWGKRLGSHAEFERPGRRLPALVCRVLALALLVLYVVAETDALAVQESRAANLALGITLPSNAQRDDLRLQLVPLCGLLAMVGIVSGLRPARAREQSTRSWAWISVLLAALLAVGLAAGFAVFPHLVLIAIDAVSIARDVSYQTAGGLNLRIERAGLLGGVALAAVLVVAAWVSSDLRAGGAGEPAAERASRGRTLYRLVTVLGMMASTLLLVAVAIPSLHANLLAGAESVIGSYELTVIALGFGGLAAGISARALGRPESVAVEAPRSAWGTRVGKAGWALIPLAVIALSLLRVVAVLGLRPRLPSSPVVDLLLTPFEYPNTSVVFVFTDNTFDWILILALPAATWALATVGGGFGRMALGVASFDVVVSTWRNFGRFLAPWIALTLVCVCAIPTCFIAGLVLYHFRLTRLNWP